MLSAPFFPTHRTTLFEVLSTLPYNCPREMRKIVCPSACPGEGAHDVISIVILLQHTTATH